MIKARNISFSYEGVSVLKDISFDIAEGDFVALLGPNGAGKTTLAKILIGLLKIQKGTIEIDGKSVSQAREFIGYMPQRYTIGKLFPGTVQEILSAQQITKDQIHDGLGIQQLLNKKFVELSGGQQQRVLITLALHNNPKILILDEPTVGVDIKTEKEFLELLKHMNEEHHITILLITHDVGMVPAIANKTLCINHDICCIGASSETHKMLKDVYGQYQEHHHHA